MRTPALAALAFPLVACAAATPDAVAPATTAAPRFIHDDFAGARSMAARENLPLLVEVEAPW